jgi:hypothetical protein
MIEGLFDEVIWLLYATKKAIKGASPDYEAMKKTALQWYKSYLNPVYFEGYNDRIRNAIAHTGFSYDENTKKMTFKDRCDYHQNVRRQAYQETLSLQEFGAKYFEKIYELFLLRVYLINLITVAEVAITDKPFGRVSLSDLK